MHKINISYWKDVRIRNTEEKKESKSIEKKIRTKYKMWS